MKKILKLSIILLISTIFFACEEDCNCNKNEDLIYNKWIKTITDDAGVTFEAILHIKEDNSYDFILVEETPGHTNSTAEFEIGEDKLKIIEDADCDSDGIYFYSATSEYLVLTADYDDCEGRKKAIEGVWLIYKE